MVEKHLQIDDAELISGLFGSYDENIRIVEKEYGVSITYRDGKLKFLGDEKTIDNAIKTVKNMIMFLSRGETLTEQNISYIISLIQDGEDESLYEITDKTCVAVTVSGKPIKPKTLGQKNYVEAIENNTIVIGVGRLL